MALVEEIGDGTCIAGVQPLDKDDQALMPLCPMRGLLQVFHPQDPSKAPTNQFALGNTAADKDDRWHRTRWPSGRHEQPRGLASGLAVALTELARVVHGDRLRCGEGLHYVLHCRRRRVVRVPIPKEGRPYPRTS